MFVFLYLKVYGGIRTIIANINVGENDIKRRTKLNLDNYYRPTISEIETIEIILLIHFDL